MENQIKSIAKSIQEMTNPQQVEETKFKVGDIVIAKKGPHKGDKHKVIHVSDDGKLNIQPLGRDVKYRQGAAGAMPNEVTLVKEDVQQVDEGMYTPGSGWGKDAQSKADKYNSLSTADQKKINSIEKILNKELRDIHLTNRCAYFNSFDLDLSGSDLKKLGGLVKRFSFDNEYDDLWIECYY